jgi:glucuronate isomerase
MKPFLSEDFLLLNETARRLYHEYAAAMPIFDYHCHLPVAEIAADKRFVNLTRIWLNGDHYKWRAMRTNGISEHYITGDAGDREKFAAWAATVPKTLRNPLYHWTHLELKRYFGISDRLLAPQTADAIYDHCRQLLPTAAFSTRNLLKKMQVTVVCTTDDPVDTLEHHQTMAADSGMAVKILPAFRPDRAIGVEDPAAFNQWIDQLATVSGLVIDDYAAFIAALKSRHDFFHLNGCRLSDHGLERPYADAFDETTIIQLFARLRRGEALNRREHGQFKTAVLLELARMDAERGWTQQFHFGALRNTNTRAFHQLGPDTGYDTIGDFEMARPLARFLDILEQEGRLARTILYILNPRDNELVATMIGNFQDGSIAGKIQFGSGWWFNDQKDGMIRQIDALSNMGLLSRFVGMLTDSRSFLSFPRHEYFRRVLCNLLGTDVENGELPHDMALIGGMVQDICYRNATRYFGIEVE